MKLKSCFVVFSIAWASAALAASVSVDRVQQRYPWNGLVDIDYTISGVAGDGCDYRLALGFSATVGGVPVSRPMTNFTVFAACDLPTSNGTWRVTWDAHADESSFSAGNFKVAASLFKTDTTLADAEYVIVDISSGAKAAGQPTGTSYPVRFVAAGLAKPVDFNRHLYKTDRLVLKRVTGGTFSMGSTTWTATKPVHDVTLSDYFLGIFEVTCTQYLRVMGQQGNVKNIVYDGNPVDERPAEGYLTWDKTMFMYTQSTREYDSFSRLLNNKSKHVGETFGDEATSVTFTLPTEAQWEFACRAGTTTKYYWGDAESGSFNYAWTSEVAKQTTHAVGQLTPNAWGFYDMIGNVSEIVYDWYGSYTADAATDPTGPATGSNKVFRGGNWFKTLADGSFGGPSAFRSTSSVLAPNSGNACGTGGCIGFRIALRLH